MNIEKRQKSNSLQTLRQQAMVLGVFLLIFWGLEIADWLSGNSLDGLGIRPRELNSLEGILFAPFLHFGFEHLLSNTFPFLLLGWFVMLRGFRTFVSVTFWTIVIGGLGTWLIAPTDSVHAGASILIFGYFGYLLLSAVFERSMPALTLTLVTLFLYSSMIWGVLPLLEGISWQGHLFGFIGGGYTARKLGRQRRAEQALRQPEEEEEMEEEIDIRLNP